MWFYDLDRSVAEGYARTVIGLHDALLWDLAQLMTASGGPVDQMDASLDSLSALWEWYRGFVDSDVPGIPQDARASYFGIPDWSFDPDSPGLRVIVADEIISHYCFEVVRSGHPFTRWAMFVGFVGGVPYSSHQVTGVQFSPLQWRMPTALETTAGWDYIHEGLAREDQLRHRIETRFFADYPAPKRTGVSILTPLLNIPRPDDSPATGPVPIYTPAPTRRVSKARAAKEAEANRPRGDIDFGGEYILAAPGAYIDDLENSTPLPTRDIIRILNDHGYATDEGRAITTRTLTDGHTDLTMPDTSTVDISVLTHRGKLRALFADVTGPDGTGILTHLHDTAPHHGARLRPTDQLPSRR